MPGRVAVIHDWLTGMRGGESVLEAILDLVPDAELFTLFHFPGSVSKAIESHTIHTSRLQSLATRVRDYRTLLPLFPRAVRQWDLSGFDLVISSSHAVAKGVDARGKPHLCYCHTPMRYIWDRFDDYFPRGPKRILAKPVAARLRRWDVAASKGVTRFVANSNFVRDRIRAYYDRDATVVHPFVDDAFLNAPLHEAREDFHVVVSALVPYKHIELAIDAAADRRLVVIGGGPLLASLRARGGPNVQFLGHVSRDVIIDHLGRAQSLILPGVEDFGITPLEAMALGTPVVALGTGGVRDSVVPGTMGIFFETAAVHSLRAALDDAQRRAWDRAAIRAHAATFSRERFHREMRAEIELVTGREWGVGSGESEQATGFVSDPPPPTPHSPKPS
ncbi:MAG TPA: glycosyltransferase [Thermoanaerobaculia bacterium]|jgi:glycosyltransferase involved in cell wall biosynthesis|nr:glycosyltransferase [Thermoanaerobaculia bacterium]